MFDGSVNSSSFDSSEITHTTSASAPSILLVEDDELLNKQLTALLKSRSYSVTNLMCGAKALSALSQSQFDLIILDVNLPEVDGFGLLNYIRAHSNTPVIMLTAFGAEEHRIRGLQFGADDYISKPCNFTEVSLRIDAILRRSGYNASPSSNRYLEHHELKLDRHEYEVSVQDANKVTLTPIQFKLLWTLVQNHGAVQSKPYLYQMVLEREFSPYDRSLDMHLSRVRKTLTAMGMPQDRIQTVHGKGYLVR
ncbi:response regulator transcription factor [Vibrio tubiashii]|uniref:Response regulator transcription factor n=1 Tax=Vibrio tubiashii TaxID=29498 RepID=A0AAE5GLD7_9VIBR|nr:response regulator transcription factor [Vibrio tubiashii]NOI79062.1 response regulator transcription factor [Vibrio tubiashii]